jgi:hypothetical protein
MPKTHRTLRLTPWLLWGGAGLLLAGACSSSDERQRAVQLAGGCLINSDCAPDLICAFGRCHRACDGDRDCDYELRCVKNESTGSFVCQLPDETVCKDDQHCPTGQVCAVDNECRDSCKEDDDCVASQVCAASGECASTEPGKGDALDESGNFILNGVSSGGSGNGGSSGSGTAPESAGSDAGGAPSAGATSGAGGDVAQPLGGAAGDTGSVAGQGNGMAGAPSLGEVDYEETEDGDPVDNGVREKAVAIRTSANLYIAAGDADWLSYQAPDDGRAHLITLELEQQASLQTTMAVFAGTDYSQLGSALLEAGVTARVYFSVSSGLNVYLSFSSLGKTKGALRMKLVDDPEQDEYEPNNRWQDAPAIALGQTITGQLLKPYVRTGTVAMEDWFKVTLAAGPATFKLLSAPEAGRIQVQRRDAEGVLVTLGTSVNDGATATYNTSIPAAGDYWFLVVPYANTVFSYANFTQPAYFTQPYSFTLTQ